MTVLSLNGDLHSAIEVPEYLNRADCIRRLGFQPPLRIRFDPDGVRRVTQFRFCGIQIWSRKSAPEIAGSTGWTSLQIL